MKGPFDIIFCRNVVIYFDKATQRELFDRMADLQEPGGWLFIGHSENLLNVTRRYKLVGRTVYRRGGGGESNPPRGSAARPPPPPPPPAPRSVACRRPGAAAVG